MGKIRLVVFDLDGTILNTLDDISAAINYTLRCYDMRPCTAEDTRRYVGSGFANALRMAISEKCERPFDEEEFAPMLALLRRYYENNATHHTVRYAGMECLLEDLVSHGIEVGVLTNKDEKVAKPLVSAFYPDVKFSFVEGKRENRALKPDRALTLSLLDSLNMRPDEALFVGDSEVDYRTAENAGSLSLIVNYGFRTREELEKSSIADSISSVRELRNRIWQLINVC